jgi:nucleoside-diphosphate kinase
MSIEQTLSIIKPDAVKAGYTDSINKIIQDSGLKILKTKEILLSNKEASKFYSIHSDKPFFNELCNFMISGPIIVQILEGENAVDLYRKIMGSTNPIDAEENTIRKKFAASIQENAVHGSDSKDNALREINFFFKE